MKACEEESSSRSSSRGYASKKNKMAGRSGKLKVSRVLGYIAIGAESGIGEEGAASHDIKSRKLET
jgi:hypothetical protein